MAPCRHLHAPWILACNRTCRSLPPPRNAGGAVVVDGAHRLRPGVLVAALGRLCADRELDLPDGKYT